MASSSSSSVKAGAKKPAPSSSKSSPGSKKSTALGRKPTGIRWGRLVALVIAGGMLLAVGGVVGIFLYYGHDKDLPRFSNVADYKPKLLTRVVDRDGELIGEIGEERRTVVPREKIPPVMIHAIVDAEDAQFYEHKGLNYMGMARAFLNDLKPGSHLQGASTITQQLVKNFLLKTNERTLRRKVQEMILAREIETKLSKDEILYIYLNQIYFGHNRYGIEEAARFYFGKSISDVNPGEAALLASLPKGPEEISPIKHPDRAKDRQRYVLSQMLRYNHISKQDADYYANAPIQLVRPPQFTGVAPEFVDEVKKTLTALMGEDKLPYLGTTVVTTCDATIQRLARESLESELEKLDERQGYRKPAAHLKGYKPGDVKLIKAYLDERALKRLEKRMDKPSRKDREDTLEARAQGLEKGKVVEAVVTNVIAKTEYVSIVDAKGKRTDIQDADTVDGHHFSTPGVIVDTGGQRGYLPLPAQKDRYNPKALTVDKRFAPGDVIWVRAEPSLGRTDGNLPICVPEFGPQASAIVMDPTSREVRAIVGGYGFIPGGYDRALRAERQPGSSFKPFLYAVALNSGKYTTASILNDSPQVYQQTGAPDWAPKNAESHEFLGPVRLRVALAKSLNTVASQLVFDLKPEALAKMANDMGIESKLDEKLSLGIGASVVKLSELTNAYATFATGGKRAQPILITKIGTEEQPRADAQQVITPEVAYLVTSMMESVIDEGTAASAKGKLKRPAAGKTGTTNSERDAWFIGFTPDLVTGVWVGFDDMRDLGHGEQGARSALPIWVDIMVGALKGVPPRPFVPPPGIVVARIDPATGLLASPTATNAIEEKFLQGTAPTQVAPEQGTQNPDTFIIDQAQ